MVVIRYLMISVIDVSFTGYLSQWLYMLLGLSMDISGGSVIVAIGRVAVVRGVLIFYSDGRPGKRVMTS